MSENNWYNTGYDAATPPPPPASDRVFRFWMPEGAETSITFIDDDTKPAVFEVGGKKFKLSLPILLREHNLHMNDSWKNWFTCLTPSGGTCPICEADDRGYEVAAFTVRDHTEWEDNSGNEHKDEKKLYMVKTSSVTYKLIQKLSKKHGGLRGIRVNLSRMGDKSPNIGNVLEFEEKVELDAKDTAFNYLALLAPKTEDELKAVVRKWQGKPAPKAAGATSAEGGGSTDDDAIPF